MSSGIGRPRVGATHPPTGGATKVARFAYASTWLWPVFFTQFDGSHQNLIGIRDPNLAAVNPIRPVVCPLPINRGTGQRVAGPRVERQ